MNQGLMECENCGGEMKWRDFSRELECPYCKENGKPFEGMEDDE